MCECAAAFTTSSRLTKGLSETPETIPELTVRVRALYRDWRDEYATGKLIEAAAAKVTAMRQAMEEGAENPEDVYEVYRELKREQVTQQVNYRRLHGGKMQELRAMNRPRHRSPCRVHAQAVIEGKKINFFNQKKNY